MPRQSYLAELWKQLPSMAEQIAEIDPDYKLYAGAPWEIALMLARLKIVKEDYLKLMSELGFLNELQRIILERLLDIRKKYLIQISKAYLASQRASEISVLGFILAGKRRRVISATRSPASEIKSGFSADF